MKSRFKFAAGTYQVGISCYGEVLIGSPFPVTVAPGPTGVTSYPFGATLGTAEAGDTTAFQLQAQDEYHNKLSTPGSFFKVWFRPAGSVGAAGDIDVQVVDLLASCLVNASTAGVSCDNATHCVDVCGEAFGGIYLVEGIATVSGEYSLWMTVRPHPAPSIFNPSPEPEIRHPKHQTLTPNP